LLQILEQVIEKVGRIARIEKKDIQKKINRNSRISSIETARSRTGKIERIIKQIVQKQ
jgi:hypothetical protein